MSPAYELVDGQPLMRDSIVLFLDVLGSQERSMDPEAQTYLNSLHEALTTSRDMLTSGPSGGFETIWFTDNIVVGCPLDDAGDVEASLGLVQSYRLERDEAIFPRIVLSDELASHAKGHSASYLNAAKLPADKQNLDFLATSDGRIFLNYLDVLPNISDIQASPLFWQQEINRRLLKEICWKTEGLDQVLLACRLS